jgi:Ca2+-binding EF-hand superfamily protein
MSRKKQQTPKTTLPLIDLPDVVIERLEQTFNSLDRKKTGSVPVNQIAKLMDDSKEDIDGHFDEEDFAEALDRIGKTDEDTINFDEFCQFVQELYNANIVVDAFNFFDNNKNGYITVDELKTILKMVDSKLTDDELAELFRLADSTKDGKIDYREFVNFWNMQ